MAEGNSGTTSIPWTTIIAVLAAAGGAIYYFSPLTSSRPSAPLGPGLESGAYQDAAARLWQDPFKAAYQRRAALALHRTAWPTTNPMFDVRLPEGTDSKQPGAYQILRRLDEPDLLHQPSTVREDIKRRFDPKSEKKILILPVMVHGGPYAEMAENRLRSRVAVLEALARCGYEPEDGEHVGYFNYSDAAAGKDGVPSVGIGADYPLVPYEWCKPAAVRMAATALSSDCRSDFQNVLVLWLAESMFDKSPLTKLAALIQTLDPSYDARNVWRVIGPRSSTGLRAVTLEAALRPALRPAPQPPRSATDPLSGVSMYSASSTADDEAMLFEVLPGQLMTGMVADFVNSRWAGFNLQRLTATDKELCESLVGELELRQIFLRGTTSTEPSALESHIDHVAVVSEWDTFYGRALPMSFAAAVLPPGNGLTRLMDGSEPFPYWIHSFVYLRGIDGRAPDENTPVDMGKENQKFKSEQVSQKPSQQVEEAPEGVAESDYLRRLADQLVDLDGDLRRRGMNGLRAVGVLGSDVYDKLLVIRALRSRLPGAIFFTTAIDARYALSTQWKDTHNLIIASPYGLRLHQYYQGAIPPFRDAYQTAAFSATLRAVRDGTPAAWTKFNLGPPRLFEIGRSGAIELTVDGAKPNPLNPETPGNSEEPGKRPVLAPPTVHPPRYDLATAPSHLGPWFTVMAIIALMLVVPLLEGALPSNFTFFKMLSYTTVWLIATVAILALGLLLLPRARTMWSEPLQPFDGVSVWPTEAIRVIAIMICIHFILKSLLDTVGSNRDVESKFHLAPPVSAASVGRQLRPVAWLKQHFVYLRLNKWEVFRDAKGQRVAQPKEPPDADLPPKDGTRVSAQDLWWEYRRCAEFGPRVLRVLVLAGLYLLLGVTLFCIFGWPHVPARGPKAFCADLIITWISVFLSVLLTFFVLDSTYLNKRFIDFLVWRYTDYPGDAYRQFPWALKRADLTEYADIQFIAMRTKVVGEVVYYPFVVFFLMVIARNSLFANWDWPVSLLVILGLNLVLAIGGALLLRATADNARDQALRRLTTRRLGYLVSKRPSDKAKAEVLAELIKQVKDERAGAFSLLSQHPYIRAILLPSGSIGIWLLLEYFARTATGS